MVDALICDSSLLLIALAVIHLAALGRRDLPARYGAMVMAIGIFARAAWRQLPIVNGAATDLLALALIGAWLAVAASHVGSMLRGTFRSQYDDPIDGLAIGTWVAGTAVLGTVTHQVFPSWHALDATLTALAVLLWCWFVTLVARGMRAMRADPLRRRVTGTVLLATVSTQSVAILVQAAAPSGMARWICPALIALGCVAYGIGLALIVQRYARQRGWRLTDDWHNTNCIVHGAVSITGLAAMSSGNLPSTWILVGWLWAFLFFVIVESIELARIHARVIAYGWRRGILTYDVSQWARNFTFGMFYAFTLALYHAEAGAYIAHPLRTLQRLIVRQGQYVVLSLLVVELCLFLAGCRHLDSRAASRTSTRGHAR